VTKLIPLADIPHKARLAERQARRRFSNRADALVAAEYEIVLAPGCHQNPPDDPPSVGWVLTPDAAEALESRVTRMPDGTCHTRLRYRRI
jgi:hypothetical protein